MVCLSCGYQMLTLFITVCKQQTLRCSSLSLLSRITYPKCLSWPGLADPALKTCIGFSLSTLKLFSIRSSCYKNTQWPKKLFWMTCLLWECIRRQWEKWISKVNFMPMVEMFNCYWNKPQAYQTYLIYCPPQIAFRVMEIRLINLFFLGGGDYYYYFFFYI